MGIIATRICPMGCLADLLTTDGKGGKEGGSSHSGNAMAGESFGILLLSKRVGQK